MRAWAVLGALATVSPALAAPAAELVVVWAPGHAVEPIAAAARDAGASLLDRSPRATAPELSQLLARGVAAYDALRFDEAWRELGRAREVADRTGADGLARAQLSDLFVYRALVRTQRGEPAAWDELVAALVVAPTRAFDPARFPPQLIEQLERARAAATGATGTLELALPAGCAARLDGDPATGGPVPRGAHFLSVACPDRAPWGTRVDLAGSMRLSPAPVPLEPPDEAELVIQARTARGLLVVVERGELAQLRLLGADGSERATRSVPIADAPAAVRALLTPTPSHPWYTSRWAWATGAAIVAAAILIPLTAAIAGEHAPTNGSLRPTGVTW